MKAVNLLSATVLALGLYIGLSAYAEETNTEKAEAVANKSVDTVKKSYRHAEDKTCEMVNGKMECTMKKLKHGAQNMSDKTESKAKEIKNKVD